MQLLQLINITTGLWRENIHLDTAHKCNVETLTAVLTVTDGIQGRLLFTFLSGILDSHHI